MKIKTRFSNVFKDVVMTDERIQSMIGLPLTDEGKRIGVVTAVDPIADIIHIDVDDEYTIPVLRNHICSFEIEKGE